MTQTAEYTTKPSTIKQPSIYYVLLAVYFHILSGMLQVVVKSLVILYPIYIL